MRKTTQYQPGMLVKRRAHAWKSSSDRLGRIVRLTSKPARDRVCTYAIVQWIEGPSTEIAITRIEPLKESA